MMVMLVSPVFHPVMSTVDNRRYCQAPLASESPVPFTCGVRTRT